jgi:hypothetical protein
VSGRAVFEYECETINGVDVCKKSCGKLHRFRDRVLFWTVWRHHCELTGWQLETFMDGTTAKAKRCDECKHLANTSHTFEDMMALELSKDSPDVPLESIRRSEPRAFDTIPAPSRFNHPNLRAVDKPTFGAR